MAGSHSVFGQTFGRQDKRDLILKEFLISEKQYVETLRMLVEKYMIPMKSQEVVDSNLTDEVFYKIQEIYVHHATLITFLAKALNRWNDKSTIGDVILKNFSKQTVIESYVSFIEHFPRAEKVLQEISSKSSFQKFIEQCERETKVKLPLKAQLVKPAQRIPRYELLLKRLLENTPTTHPDFTLLRQAEGAIHDLALKINEVNKGETIEDVHTSTLKKLELLLITDLVSSGRCYVRNDMVTIDQMRDQCCMWLFTDLLLLSFVKRKNSGINKKATLLLQSINGNDYVENVKHKVWLKVPLTAVKIIHSTLSQDMNEKTQAKQRLETDNETLNQIAGLSAKLNCLHISVDEAIQSVSMEISRKLKEIQSSSASSSKDHYLLLYVATQDTLHQLCVTFSSADKQMNWELTFLCHKQKAENR